MSPTSPPKRMSPAALAPLPRIVHDEGPPVPISRDTPLDLTFPSSTMGFLRIRNSWERREELEERPNKDKDKDDTRKTLLAVHTDEIPRTEEEVTNFAFFKSFFIFCLFVCLFIYFSVCRRARL
jgi:hypothetical protein